MNLQSLEFILSAPVLTLAILLIGSLGWCIYLRMEADEAIWHRHAGEED